MWVLIPKPGWIPTPKPRWIPTPKPTPNQCGFSPQNQGGFSSQNQGGFSPPIPSAPRGGLSWVMPCQEERSQPGTFPLCAGSAPGPQGQCESRGATAGMNRSVPREFFISPLLCPGQGPSSSLSAPGILSRIPTNPTNLQLNRSACKWSCTNSRLQDPSEEELGSKSHF